MPSLRKTLGLGESSDTGNQPDAEVYSFMPTTEDDAIVQISLSGQKDSDPPIYTAKLSTKKSPDVLVWRDYSTDDKAFARATVTKSTCSAELLIHGATLLMQTDICYGSTTVAHPRLGTLKWKVSKLSGNPSTLCDEQDNELAKHKTVGLHYSGGPRELTVRVPHDEELLEFIVLTVLVARRLSGIAQERIATVVAIT